MTRKQADAAFDSLRRHSSAIPPPSGPADALRLLDGAVLTKLQRDAMVHYISVGPDNLALAYSIVKAGAATFATAPFVGLERWDAGDAAGVWATAGAGAGAGAAAGVGATAGPGAGDGAAARSGSSGPTDRSADRDLFAARMIALADELERAEPAQRATRLLDAFTGYVSAAREGFAGGSADGPAAPADGPARAAAPPAGAAAPPAGAAGAPAPPDGAATPPAGAAGAAAPPDGAATLRAASPADPDPAVGNLLEAAGIAYLIGQLLESPPRHAATAIAR